MCVPYFSCQKYVGITVSSREQKHFRDGIVKIAATKVSAGVSTGIGDHESKYTGKDTGESGDEQFEIPMEEADQMYNDMESGGLQPVLNDYVCMKNLRDQPCAGRTSFLEQLACVLATKPYAMILREKDLTEEAYEELARKSKKSCVKTWTPGRFCTASDATVIWGYGHSYAAASVYGDARRTKAEIFVRGVSVHSVEDARLAEQMGNLSDGRACVCDRL